MELIFIVFFISILVFLCVLSANRSINISAYDGGGISNRDIADEFGEFLCDLFNFFIGVSEVWGIIGD
jgi:hypothetical protein